MDTCVGANHNKRKSSLPVYCLLLFCYLWCGCQGVKTKSVVLPDNEPIIRVLLVHASGKNPPVVGTTGAYVICDAQNQALVKEEKLAASQVRLEGDFLRIGPNRYALAEAWLRPGLDSKVIVNNIQYYGDLQFLVMPGGQLQVINSVLLDHYISCVLVGEMPLFWPESALQAQAIIARTYALYEKFQNTDRHFDVYDTVQSQVYPGISGEHLYARGIVRSTAGLVLLYQNSLFKTFFHSTCGGHTASAKDIFQYQDITPLAGRPCPFCQESKYFQWEYEAGLADLELMLADAKLPPPFLGLAPGKKTEHERLLTLEVHFGNRHQKSLDANVIRRLLGDDKIRSTYLTMEPATQGILFKGKGWGHGVGMCQVGASKMASIGYTPLQIVEFYYPGASAYRLWK